MLNHSLCILPRNLNGDNDYYGDLYTIIGEFLKKGYAVIYAAESRSPDKIIGNLAKTIKVDAEAYVKQGALTVLDYQSVYRYTSSYFGMNEEDDDDNSSSSRYSAISVPSVLDRWKVEIEKKKQESNSKQILIVGTCLAFYERLDHDGLMAYETGINNELLLSTPPPSSSINSLTDIPSTSAMVERICCYPASITNHIASFPMMASILLHHNSIVASGANNQNIKKKNIEGDSLCESETVSTSCPWPSIQPLNHGIILDSIHRGIDEILGTSTRNLILDAVKLICQIAEEEVFVRQPDLFVDALVDILGEEAANPILQNILFKLKQRILFS